MHTSAVTLTSQIHTDTQIFKQLEKEWKQLLTRSNNNEVFLTPEFQFSWWQTLGSGELRIVTFYDEDKLVGLAPLFIDQGKLALIGCVDVSDYLDLIIDRQYEEAVYQQLAQLIQAKITNWQSLVLCSLRQQSRTHDYFAKLFLKGFRVEKTEQDVCPVIQLPSTWDEYLSSLDRHQRHEIRRKRRKLEQETDARFILIEKNELVTSEIKEFIKLHKLSSPQKKRFWNEAHVNFFTEFATATAKQGWLKLYFLELDGHYYSSMLILDYNNQFQLYNSGFDPNALSQYSTGNVLTAYTIEQAIKLGRSRYDFLRGDESYKFRFGAKAEPIYDLEISKEK